MTSAQNFNFVEAQLCNAWRHKKHHKNISTNYRACNRLPRAWLGIRKRSAHRILTPYRTVSNSDCRAHRGSYHNVVQEINSVYLNCFFEVDSEPRRVFVRRSRQCPVIAHKIDIVPSWSAIMAMFRGVVADQLWKTHGHRTTFVSVCATSYGTSP